MSKTVPNDLSKLSNVVDTDILKKTVYDKSVKKVNAVRAIGTYYNIKIEDIGEKILIMINILLLLNLINLLVQYLMKDWNRSTKQLNMILLTL